MLVFPSDDHGGQGQRVKPKSSVLEEPWRRLLGLAGASLWVSACSSPSVVCIAHKPPSRACKGSSESEYAGRVAVASRVNVAQRPAKHNQHRKLVPGPYLERPLSSIKPFLSRLFPSFSLPTTIWSSPAIDIPINSRPPPPHRSPNVALARTQSRKDLRRATFTAYAPSLLVLLYVLPSSDSVITPLLDDGRLVDNSHGPSTHGLSAGQPSPSSCRLPHGQRPHRSYLPQYAQPRRSCPV